MGGRRLEDRRGVHERSHCDLSMSRVKNTMWKMPMGVPASSTEQHDPLWPESLSLPWQRCIQLFLNIVTSSSVLESNGTVVRKLWLGITTEDLTNSKGTNI